MEADSQAGPASTRSTGAGRVSDATGRCRSDHLARLLAGVQVGIALNEHTDARGASWCSGTRCWLKVKNPEARVVSQFDIKLETRPKPGGAAGARGAGGDGYDR
jgi:hypothetical protein